MGKKYLIPALIGIGVLVLVLVAGALLCNGQEEGAGGLAALAAVIAEVARRRRAGARKELAEIVDDAEEDITQAEELRDEAISLTRKTGDPASPSGQPGTRR